MATKPKNTKTTTKKSVTAHKGIDWDQLLKKDKVHLKNTVVGIAANQGVSPNSVRAALRSRGIDIPDQDKIRAKLKRLKAAA